MDDIRHLRIELNTLRQQVRYLLAKESAGGIPVKVSGVFDDQYFDTSQGEYPTVSDDPDYLSDVFVVEVYGNGLGQAWTKQVLALRVPVTPDDKDPAKIKPGKLFFAIPAKKEDAGSNKIELYITESGVGSGVPVKILGKASGLTYTYDAEIYENGIEPGEGFTSGRVEQVDINSDQTIPSGTWAMASKNPNGIYYVQVPVWL